MRVLHLEFRFELHMRPAFPFPDIAGTRGRFEFVPLRREATRAALACCAGVMGFHPPPNCAECQGRLLQPLPYPRG